MKLQIVWPLVASVCTALLVLPVPGAAEVNTYDLDGGWEGFTNGGAWIGKDGWAGTNGDVKTPNAGGPGSGFFLQCAGYTAGTGSRTNDLNWGYAIPPGSPRIVLEMDVQKGYTGTGRNTQANFGLATGSSEHFWFGVGSTSTGAPKYAVWRPAGQLLSSTSYSGPFPPAKHLELEVSLLANAGAGSASMYLDGSPIADLQNINLGLATDPATWDGIWVKMKSYTQADNFMVKTTIPGDANVDDLVDLQDFGLLKANYGGPGGWGQGDFNGDNSIDLQDFGIMKAHFGESQPSPEPATIGLLAIGACLPLLRRRTCLLGRSRRG